MGVGDITPLAGGGFSINAGSADPNYRRRQLAQVGEVLAASFQARERKKEERTRQLKESLAIALSGIEQGRGSASSAEVESILRKLEKTDPDYVKVIREHILNPQKEKLSALEDLHKKATKEQVDEQIRQMIESGQTPGPFPSGPMTAMPPEEALRTAAGQLSPKQFSQVAGSLPGGVERTAFDPYGKGVLSPTTTAALAAEEGRLPPEASRAARIAADLEIGERQEAQIGLQEMLEAGREARSLRARETARGQQGLKARELDLRAAGKYASTSKGKSLVDQRAKEIVEEAKGELQDWRVRTRSLEGEERGKPPKVPSILKARQRAKVEVSLSETLADEPELLGRALDALDRMVDEGVDPKTAAETILKVLREPGGDIGAAPGP